MKNILNLRAFVMLMIMMCSIDVWAEDVTYTITSTTAVSTNGVAPVGSSATFANTYTTKDQLTAGKKMTLTLSGFTGKIIKELTLSMKSNGSSGAGYLSMTAGTTTLASIGSTTSGVPFNNSLWNGSYTTTYTNVRPTMVNDNYIIQDGENVVIVVGATANSLYCQSFKITYIEADDPNVASISIKNPPIQTSYMEGQFFNPEGLVITKHMTDDTNIDVTYNDETKNQFTFTPNLNTELSVETTEIIIQYAGKSDILNINVSPFVPTAGTYTILLNKDLYGLNPGSNGNEQSTTKYGITVISGCSSSSLNKTYYDGAHIRYYADSYLKLSAPAGFVITKVVMHDPLTDKKWETDGISVNTGNYNDEIKTWEGSASQVEFTMSGQCRIASVEVTYVTSSTPAKTLRSIGLGGVYVTKFWKGDIFNHEGLTVTAYYSDESTKDVSAQAVISEPDMSTAGEAIVDVSYSEGGYTANSSYKILIQTIENTKEKAYTVSEARALIDAGKDLATQVYVKGIVSEIVTPWSDQYKNITYNISVDGSTDGNQFQLFRCVTNDVTVEDQVVAYGQLTKYGSIYEFAAGNSIVSITHPTVKTTPVITLNTYETNLEADLTQDYLEIEYVVEEEDIPTFEKQVSVSNFVKFGGGNKSITIAPLLEGISTILIQAKETEIHKPLSTRFSMIVNGAETDADNVIWTKVIDKTQLQDGDEVIIVATEDKKAFCEISPNNGPSAKRGIGYDVSISDDGNTVTGAKYATVFKLVASDGNFGLYSRGKYLMSDYTGSSNEASDNASEGVESDKKQDIAWSDDLVANQCVWAPEIVGDGDNASLFFKNIRSTDFNRGILYSKIEYSQANYPNSYVFGNYSLVNYGKTIGHDRKQSYSPVAIYKRNHTLTLAANKTIEGEKYYYATFSNDDAVTFFPKVKENHYSAVVETVDIEKIGGQNILDVNDLDETTIKVDKENVVGYYIPAKAGVLIKVGLENDNKKNIHYYLMKKDDVAELENNKLRSASVPMEESGYKFYKLAYKEWNGSAETSTGLGFWWGNDNGGSFSCKVGTAYLAIEADESPARGFVFDDVPDGIEEVSLNTNDGYVYNLNGQRIVTPIRGQIYIQNGKKFIAK